MKDKFISLEEAQKNQSGNIPELDDMNSRIKDLEKKISNIEKGAERAHEQNRSSSNFIMWIVGAIALGFLVIITQVSLDYFKNNQERYEKFINKTEEIRSDYYSKKELDSALNETKNTAEILNCIKTKGYFSMKCF
ncbi:hypothetical protein KJ742_06430 [Patescibacteria group bacterium]|nr:hypothetical protein [Patescibacteria group bacterium]MBU1683548.1 hypothetical protein [Patescibacteria group bacterium]